MATKTVCDYCGEVIPEFITKLNGIYKGDWDNDHLAVIEVKPKFLNSSKGDIGNPDLCISCIIKTLQN